MSHPRTGCKNAVIGSRASLVVCSIGIVPDDSHVGACKTCHHYDGPSRGLGDTVAKFTQATGIKAATKFVARATGRDCNCGKRRAKLNQAVPYEPVRILDEAMKTDLSDDQGKVD